MQNIDSRAPRRIYEITDWNMAFLAAAARMSHRHAIAWKRRWKESLLVGGSNTTWYYDRYMSERNYARAIMMCLTAVDCHQTPADKRAMRHVGERMGKVVA